MLSEVVRAPPTGRSEGSRAQQQQRAAPTDPEGRPTAAARRTAAAGPPAEISTAPRCRRAPIGVAHGRCPRCRAARVVIQGTRHSSHRPVAPRAGLSPNNARRAGTSTPPKRNTAGPIISSGILASSPSFATSSSFIPSLAAAVPALRHALHKVSLRSPLRLLFFRPPHRTTHTLPPAALTSDSALRATAIAIAIARAAAASPAPSSSQSH